MLVFCSRHLRRRKRRYRLQYLHPWKSASNAGFDELQQAVIGIARSVDGGGKQHVADLEEAAGAGDEVGRRNAELLPLIALKTRHRRIGCAQIGRV